MAAKLPNAVNTGNAAVTRWKKRRDLESTMNTLKKLLEPSLTIKKGRKKNKPRSLPKKKLPTRTINRCENSDDDGEYYPNTLKRKCRMKKIVLKPKHVLKVVVATNKRKRGTPHKGLEYEEVPSPTSDLRVHTPPPSSTPGIIKYELISPPHKSLTEMTVDDLMRMDEDSLSDEDLMEILTCPSPVWWEDPANEYRGTLYLIKASQTITETNDIEENTRTIVNKSSEIEMNLKRNGIVNEFKGKAKKIAKLESILGNIKNRVLLNDKSVSNNDDKKAITEDSLVINDKVHDKIDHDLKEENLSSDDTNIKPRALSSSCSDNSVNEDDLLRNLESIDIPIGKTNAAEDVHDNTDAIEMKNKVRNDVENSSNNIQNNTDLKYDETENIQSADKDTALKQNIWVKTSRDSKQRTAIKAVEVPEHEKNIVNQKELPDLNKKVAKFKSIDNSSESIDKSILKKLKTQSEDILDVRLIQTPTNISNEVKIWSQLDNFKRHNFRPEDFDTDVIDVEDEIEIISTSDPLNTKNETILIDDDSSNDAPDVNTKSTVKNVLCVDNTEGNVNLITGESNIVTSKDAEALVNDKNIINIDTIKIGNTLSVRLIETSDKMQNELTKPKKGKKPIVKIYDPIIKPLKVYTKAKKNKMAEIRKIRGLPKDTLETILPTYPTCLKESNPKTYTKKTAKHTDELNKNNKPQNYSILKTIDTKKSADDIVQLSDLEVSLEPIKEKVFDSSNEIAKKTEHLKNNDLSITLVKRSEVKSVSVPLMLPTLTKNPKSFESPKSVKSLTSEYSEGTISDTNIHYLDEYQDNKNIEEEYLDEESDSLPDGEEIENMTKVDQIAEIKLIYLKQNDTNESAKAYSDKEPDIEEEYLEDNIQSSDEDMSSKNINDQKDIKLNDLNQNEENRTTTEKLDDITSIEEEYLDEDKEYLEYSQSIDEANDKNNQDSSKIDNIEQISDDEDRTNLEDTKQEERLEAIDQNAEDKKLKGCEEKINNDFVTVYQIVSKPK